MGERNRNTEPGSGEVPPFDVERDVTANDWENIKLGLNECRDFGLWDSFARLGAEISVLHNARPEFDMPNFSTDDWEKMNNQLSDFRTEGAWDEYCELAVNMTSLHREGRDIVSWDLNVHKAEIAQRSQQLRLKRDKYEFLRLAALMKQLGVGDVGIDEEEWRWGICKLDEVQPHSGDIDGKFELAICMKELGGNRFQFRLSDKDWELARLQLGFYRDDQKWAWFTILAAMMDRAASLQVQDADWVQQPEQAAPTPSRRETTKKTEVPSKATEQATPAPSKRKKTVRKIEIPEGMGLVRQELVRVAAMNGKGITQEVISMGKGGDWYNLTTAYLAPSEILGQDSPIDINEGYKQEWWERAYLHLNDLQARGDWDKVGAMCLALRWGGSPHGLPLDSRTIDGMHNNLAQYKAEGYWGSLPLRLLEDRVMFKPGYQFEVTDSDWDNMLQALARQRTEGDWARFAWQAMALRLLGVAPEKLELDETAWQGMQKRLVDIREEERWGDFLWQAAAMRILVAKEARLKPSGGLEIVD
jgi:hypothetical protein